ncbi:unnamed protein product [Diamesa serratosioi]
MSRESTVAKLESYLDQAVNHKNEDLDISSIDAFCEIVKNDPDVSLTATRLIAAKIQSQNTKESLFSLEALEECMDSLHGTPFQLEINKFKFLNELIRLVSKKFLGDKTPKEIQDRILDILFTWSDKYPELTKIKEAYTMLRTQGVVHEPQKNVIKSSSKKQTDSQLKLMESEKFKKLLYSKNVKDIEAANLMIQNMVRDNDRKIQMQNRRLIDLQSAFENGLLLKEMLNEYNPSESSEDTLSTLREIFSSCEKLKPTVTRLAEEPHESEAFISKVLETLDCLNVSMVLYTARIVNKEPAPVIASKNQTSNNLLDVGATSVKPQEVNDNGNLSELNDIFSTPTNHSKTPTTEPFQINNILTPQLVTVASNAATLELITSNLATINKSMNSTATQNSDDLMKNFEIPKESPQKIEVKPKERLCELDSIISGMKNSLMSGVETKVQEVIEIHDSDDDKVLIEEEIEEVQNVVELKVEPVVKKSLAEIEIDLNDIQPNEMEAPRTVLDEKKGLKVQLNFTKDCPAKDVMVLVITVINQGPNSITNFQFDASVSKPCKVRLLPASSVELPGVKPFKPPTETINQVLLLMNPTQNPVNMVCILNYIASDDPDPVKESIEIKDIPYVS